MRKQDILKVELTVSGKEREILFLCLFTDSNTFFFLFYILEPELVQFSQVTVCSPWCKPAKDFLMYALKKVILKSASTVPVA